MASFNKGVLLGKLTRDPETRYTLNGTAVASFGLTVNRRYRPDEEWRDEREACPTPGTRKGLMHMFHPLEIPVPPMLEEAIGYDGDDRYVAFYWTPAGDAILWDTGWSSATGQWLAWLIFVRHPRIASALMSDHLGSSDQEATHWLLLDRHERTVSLSPGRDVHAFLREPNRPATWAAEPDAEAEPVVIDAAFLDILVERIVSPLQVDSPLGGGKLIQPRRFRRRRRPK